MLLTPGVFFRLGDNSSAMMISPSLTDTELRLDKGEATVEVAQLYPQNSIVVAQDGAKIRLAKTGFTISTRMTISFASTRVKPESK